MKSDILQRAITGALFIAVLLLAMWHSFISFSLLFFITSLLGLNEFYSLYKSSDLKPNKSLGIALGGLFFCFFPLYLLHFNHLLLLNALLTIPLLVFLFISELYRKNDRPFSNIALTIAGVFYAVVPFGLLMLANYTNEYVVFSTRKYTIAYTFFFILWANDTGAYLAGSWLGKNRLFERISPKKSWEGFAGGALSALLLAYICFLSFEFNSLLFWLIAALIIVVFGTFGDLTESMLKRSLKAKDSGSILPGHGGILDRFDGLLLAAPILYFFIEIWNLFIGIEL